MTEMECINKNIISMFANFEMFHYFDLSTLNFLNWIY